MKAAKEAKKLRKGKGVSQEDSEQDDQKGVMFHEYDPMFHYLLASLRCADGKNSVTVTGSWSGTKLFDIFAGLGEHR